MRTFLLSGALLSALLILPGCQSTRAEQRVSSGMTSAQVRQALGEPHTRTRTIKGGTPIDVWMFREVQPRPDGSTEVVDSAVTLRDGRVVGVRALTATPAANAAVSATEALGGRTR